MPVLFFVTDLVVPSCVPPPLQAPALAEVRVLVADRIDLSAEHEEEAVFEEMSEKPDGFDEPNSYSSKRDPDVLVFEVWIICPLDSSDNEVGKNSDDIKCGYNLKFQN